MGEEANSTIENEEALFNDFLEIGKEKDRVLKEMNAGKAGNIQELTSQMDELIKKETGTWEAYKEAVQESHKRENI